MSACASISGRIELAEDAPDIDLSVRVVENRGLEVVMDLHKGRTVGATVDLPSSRHYEVILRERPALVCPQQDYMAFMEEFLDAPIEIQLGILDMFYQPLDSPMGQSLLEPTRVLFLLGMLEDATVIHQLLCILMTNGHQYHGDHVALVIFGSKFSHSCQPNAAFSSMAEDGCLEYFVLTNIARGDEVTFSYLSDLFETPTLERRQLLWETKSFRCTCARCMGPDYCRCLRCPSCHAMMICDYQRDNPRRDNSDDTNLGHDADSSKTDDKDDWFPLWKCDSCQSEAETQKLLRKEREIRQILRTIEHDLMSRQNFDPSGGTYKSDMSTSPTTLRDLVQECIDELSATHFLTIKTLRLLVVSSTTQSYMRIKQSVVRGHWNYRLDLQAMSNMRLSVMAGIQLVLACECVAANCTGCYIRESKANSEVTTLLDCFAIQHSPHYDRATPMRHVLENLLQLPVFLWPPDSMTMSHRYLPTLRVKFKHSLRHQLRSGSATGDNTEEEGVDMLDWFDVCLQQLCCRECGTFWDGFLEGIVLWNE
jgi:SET domain